jgi:hypothetical protein
MNACRTTSLCAISATLQAFPPGATPESSTDFTNTTKPVATVAYSRKPAPARTPIAAEHQSVAAVLSPRTLKPSRKISPAPRKPIPETTWAATRVGLASPGVSAAKMTKVAAPRDTRVLVRRPARRLRHCRSKPMTALRPKATAKIDRHLLKALSSLMAPTGVLVVWPVSEHQERR